MPEDTPEPKITVDIVVSAWNSHDPTRLVACFAPDAVFEEVALGNTHRGSAAIMTFLSSLFTSFPDLAMTAEHRVEQGENLVWEWIITGTHQEEFQGIPATGSIVQIRGVSFCLLRGGKIAEDREYWNWSSLQKQLGAGP